MFDLITKEELCIKSFVIVQWLKVKIMQSVDIFFFKLARSVFRCWALRLTVNSTSYEFVDRFLETLEPVVSVNQTRKCGIANCLLCIRKRRIREIRFFCST